MNTTIGMESQGAITTAQPGNNRSKTTTGTPGAQQTTRETTSYIDVNNIVAGKQHTMKTNHGDGTSLTGSDNEHQATGTCKQQKRKPMTKPSVSGTRKIKTVTTKSATSCQQHQRPAETKDQSGAKKKQTLAIRRERPKWRRENDKFQNRH